MNREGFIKVGIAIMISIIGILLAIAIVVDTYHNAFTQPKQDAKAWNNGICSECHTDWHIEKIEDEGEQYVFKCDNQHYISIENLPDSLKKTWNNGVCPKCNSKWQYEQKITNGWAEWTGWVEYLFKCKWL